MMLLPIWFVSDEGKHIVYLFYALTRLGVFGWVKLFENALVFVGVNGRAFFRE